MAESLPNFELLESILWEPEIGYFLLEEHLQRLAKSARYFNFKLSLPEVSQRLQTFATSFSAAQQKVRLKVSQEGELTLEAQTLDRSLFSAGAHVGIAAQPVDRQIPFLYHKTTYRFPYNAALASQPGCQDVLMWNQEGCVTESTIANVAIATPRGLMTPPVKCGLLPGTFRAKLLAQGKIKEGIITLEDVRKADTVFLINSVRGWMRLEKEPAGDRWQVVSDRSYQ